MRILIVKTSSMGDVIHCLPIIADIRAHFPHAEIDWMIEEGFANIVALHPHIRQVIPVAIRRWRTQLFRKSTWAALRALKQQLKSQHYDVVLDMQSLFKSALLATLATGIRHGQNYKTTREPLAALFYHKTHVVPRDQHAVEQNRKLASLALGYPLPVTLPDYGLPTGLQTNSEITLPDTYVIALHATSRDSKLWPVANWTRLGEWLNQQGYTLVLPWASESEHQRALSIANGLQAATVLPSLRLAELATVIAGAKAAIGVDTGLIHLAVAFNIPSIAIYTDTHPALNGAYAGEHSKVLNIGGKQQSPETGEVIAAFNQLDIRKSN